MTPNSAPEDHKNPIKKITILLAGNHSVVRQGLRLLLEKQTDLEIVGETSNGLETLREVDRLKPAVLIVDLAVPQLSGLEIVARLAATGSRLAFSYCRRTPISSLWSTVLKAARRATY